jgi:hypothetical protein
MASRLIADRRCHAEAQRAAAVLAREDGAAADAIGQLLNG